MPVIRFGGAQYRCAVDETILDCLLRHDVALTHSCRSGICQSCMLRAVKGSVPAEAQQGLKETFRAAGYFLACSWRPAEDLEVARIDAATLRVRGQIETLQPLNGTVMRVRVTTREPLEYRPGQFVNLVRGDGLTRSYSLASLPGLDPLLEFHVAWMNGGRMSTWIHQDAAPGNGVELQGPVGDCFYLPGRPEQPLFLLGTGTGLAPLYGILRDALRQGHTGPIHLFHGSPAPVGLYLVEELRQYAAHHGNVHYHPCVLQADGARNVIEAPLDVYSLATVGSLKGWRVFLCGNPDIVRQMQKKCFLAGASLADIHADAFVLSASH